MLRKAPWRRSSWDDPRQGFGIGQERHWHGDRLKGHEVEPEVLQFSAESPVGPPRSGGPALGLGKLPDGESHRGPVRWYIRRLGNGVKTILAHDLDTGKKYDDVRSAFQELE